MLANDYDQTIEFRANIDAFLATGSPEETKKDGALYVAGIRKIASP